MKKNYQIAFLYRIGISALIIIIGLTSTIKGQTILSDTEACFNDTVYIPVYVDSINDYETIRTYHLQHYYFEQYLSFIGIDSSHTVIPPNGINIQKTAYPDALKRIDIDVDADNLTLYEINPDAPILVTLMFKPYQAIDSMHSGYLSVKNHSADETGTTYDLTHRISIYNNTLEVSDMPTLNLQGLTISATRGYEHYKWSYRKKYNWNAPYGDLHYDGADAYFNGLGIYSVSATDEYGCQLLAEKYIEISSMPGIKVESSAQITEEDTLTVTLTSMCVYYSCFSEDFKVNTVNFYFEYDPAKLAFDTCLFENTIFPEGYFNGYTIEEMTIDSGFVSMQIDLLVNDSQPDFEYIEYAEGNFVKLKFIPQATGKTKIGMPYFEINGTQAVTATTRQSIEIIKAEEHRNYAKGTVWNGGSPCDNGDVIAYQQEQGQYIQAAQTIIDNGYFEFPATLNDGQYIFQAIPDEHSSYLPTYYGNKQKAEDAFVINLYNCDGVVGLNIDLTLETLDKTKFNQSKYQTAFKLYPVPASDYITIQMDDEKRSFTEKSLTIKNINGKVIFRQPIEENYFSINIQNYPQGIFLVEIENTSRFFIKK